MQLRVIFVTVSVLCHHFLSYMCVSHCSCPLNLLSDKLTQKLTVYTVSMVMTLVNFRHDAIDAIRHNLQLIRLNLAWQSSGYPRDNLLFMAVSYFVLHGAWLWLSNYIGLICTIESSLYMGDTSPTFGCGIIFTLFETVLAYSMALAISYSSSSVCCGWPPRITRVGVFWDLFQTQNLLDGHIQSVMCFEKQWCHFSQPQSWYLYFEFPIILLLERQLLCPITLQYVT